MHRLRAGGLAALVVVACCAACSGATATGERSAKGGSTPTSASPPSSSTTAATPTLGAANAGCQGCGAVAPAGVTLKGYSRDGDAFGGMEFTEVQWQSWGAGQATAPMTHAYYESAGEYGAVTLVAFDLGTCGGVYGYRALEWVGSSQAFDPSSYYDTCTGEGVGRGYPGYPQ